MRFNSRPRNRVVKVNGITTLDTLPPGCGMAGPLAMAVTGLLAAAAATASPQGGVVRAGEGVITAPNGRCRPR